MAETFHELLREEKNTEPVNVELFIAIPAAVFLAVLVAVSAADTISQNFAAITKISDSAKP